MKKILLILLSCVLGFYLSAATETIDGIEWTYQVSNGEAQIYKGKNSSAIASATSGPITIPSTLGGYSVTSLGDYAFFGCSSLTSVTIPESVTSIRNYAFYNCSSLTSVTIPEGVTSIGSYAFYNCSGLTSVTIPNGVKTIGALAFYNCSGLTSVTIPNGVKTIGASVFRNCTSLTSVTIPSSVTSIGDSAFSGCSGLISVTIPSSVTSIGYEAFWGCARLASVTIPEGVTTIGKRAFQYCYSLTSVTIPEGVTSIGVGAFEYCRGLTSVTIPEGVTTIGDSAFNGVAPEILTVVKIPSGSMSFDKLKTIIIPEGTTIIPNSAFSGCSGLISVTIPSSVTSIGDSAFYDCSGLTSVTIPSSVTSIGSSAFLGCSALTSVIFDGIPPQEGDGYGFDVGPMGYYFVQYASEWEKVIAEDGTWNGLAMRCMEVGKLTTLTFDANGGEGSQTLTQAYGTTFTAPMVTREGYAFVGWYPTVPSKIPVQNVTYTAQWQINQYTITFDAVGGEGGTSVTQDYGSSLAAPTVTREGYTFVGWSPSVPVTVPATNTTYMAQWRVNQYIQTFDASGGEGGASLTQDYAASLIAPTVTREGYTFVGWSPEVPTTVPAANATYTAQWQINQYTITFDAAGGEGGTSVTQDYAASLIAPTVTREGYTFVGWLPEVPSITPAVNAIYVAQWAKVYEVKVNCKGDGTVSGVGFYQSGASIVLTATPDEGVTFCGWDGFNKTAEATIFFVMPEEDVVLSAYFANASALDAYLSTHENSGGDADDLDSLVEAEIAKRDLHTADEMKEMVVDTPVIEAKNGVVTIRLQVKDGAASEVMDGGAISVEITPKAGEKAGFYKFVVPNAQ